MNLNALIYQHFLLFTSIYPYQYGQGLPIDKAFFNDQNLH